MSSLTIFQKRMAALLQRHRETRILVVDDDEFFRGRVEEVLHRAGYRTLSAADGEEALTLLRLGEFDLLLTDWSMPHLDGVGLVRALRAIGNQIPVMMVSSSLTPSGMELPDDVRAEVAIALPKGTNAREILAAVTRALPRGFSEAQ